MLRPQTVQADAIYSLAELEQRGISPNAIHQARKLGLPVHRLGRKWYVHGRDLIEWLRRQTSGDSTDE